jgi:uncharacterized protein YkwD
MRCPIAVCYNRGMRTLVSSVLLALSTVACTAGPPAAAPVSPPATPAARSCGIANLQASMLARVNAARARGASCGSAGRFGPAPPLAWNDALARAAERHSRDMVAANLFSHTGSDKTELRQRADAVGYPWRTLAENIAGGRGSVDGTVQQWLDSPGHCANLMKPDLVHVGVACALGGPRSTYTHYWTMALGAPMR